MTRVYLIRHGTTEWNREEIFRGRADCPLNDTGRAEAQAAAAYLREVEIEKIYTSPLSRAAETAAAVAAERKLQAIPDLAFIDLDFGEWQGLPLKEVREKYPDLYRTWRERPQDATFPGGENLAQVRARAWEGLLRVARDNPEKTTLIVSHRVITKVLICAALGLDNSHFWQIKQDTTAINCLEYARDQFVAALINDTCHLKGIHASAWRKDF
ncbi:MAG TPA: histidine phosphatase family protein [Thermodesulfobacteriota bacterium]|nr:histidine phosphatase family protein [Thermodesulfobacteriota bacterium]